MEPILRRSPVIFSEKPVKTEMKDGFQVVLEYAGQGEGPWLIDLCHKPRWDVQDKNVGDIKPFGVAIPEKPNQTILENGVLINRMNGTQAFVTRLLESESFEEPYVTETTEATVFLALVGNNAFRIAEKVSSMDFLDPKKEAPFLIQGPFSHVPAQLTVLEREGVDGALLLTCSRGYAHDMVEALMHAGKEFGLKPAGEAVFTEKIS